MTSSKRPQRDRPAQDNAAEPLILTAAESAQFAEMLLSPPEPNEALRRAFLRHRELIAPE